MKSRKFVNRILFEVKLLTKSREERNSYRMLRKSLSLMANATETGCALGGVYIGHFTPEEKTWMQVDGCFYCRFRKDCEYTTLPPDLRGESCQYYSLVERFGADDN